jgi:hypothetical protein
MVHCVKGESKQGPGPQVAACVPRGLSIAKEGLEVEVKNRRKKIKRYEDREYGANM